MSGEARKLKYFTHKLSHNFISKRPFYFFWIPLNKSCYQKLKDHVGGGSEVDRSVGMLEQGKMFGRGKIGVASDLGDWNVEGEFTAHEIIGDYAQLKKVYPQMMKENPNAKERYTLYLTDPNEVPMEENKTWILCK